jgi:predicted metalloprotease
MRPTPKPATKLAKQSANLGIAFKVGITMESGAEVIEALQELTRASGKRVKCKPMAELSQMSKGADAITPRIELHADCYAGLRAGQSNITTALDPGNLEEALGAAGALGDDRIQERVQGFAVPNGFSHRTSA